MYKLCKTEQSAARQRELELQLLDMMHSHRYEEITVSNFCARAGIPRKAFYRYFSSKDGALHALIDHTLLELESFSLAGKIQRGSTYQREMVRFFRFWQSQKPLLDALDRSDISGVLVTRTVGYTLSDSGATRRFLPQDALHLWEYAATFGVCGFMSMVLSWHRSGYQLRPEQMAEIATELLSKPLFPPDN